MLLTFILAFVISYILNPYVTTLERILHYRSLAVCIVLACFIVCAVLALFFIIPPLYAQSLRFIEQLPEFLRYIYTQMQELMPAVQRYIDTPGFEQLQQNFSKAFFGIAKALANQVLRSTITIVNFVVAIVLIPIMAFYYLNDWSKICAAVDCIIPRKNYKIIKTQLEIINNNIAGYIRGQIKVCLILGVFYSILLKCISLQYSLFIGITTGILSFVPYVGAIFGFIASHLVAFSQFESALSILLVTIIFASGQMLESLFLTPKLIGKSINLHPAWVVFAIILGGELFGFVGILLSIPVASTIAVLLRFGISQYKKSRYYEAKTTTLN